MSGFGQPTADKGGDCFPISSYLVLRFSDCLLNRSGKQIGKFVGDNSSKVAEFMFLIRYGAAVLSGFFWVVWHSG